jgi:hypothetical protein
MIIFAHSLGVLQWYFDIISSIDLSLVCQIALIIGISIKANDFTISRLFAQFIHSVQPHHLIIATKSNL